MKTFAEVAEDPVLAGTIAETIKRLSGRTDFGVVIIIASREGLSMLNSIRDREALAEVLEDALAKTRGTAPDKAITAATPS